MLHSEARKVVLDTSVILRGIRAKEANQNDSHSYKILKWLEAGDFILMLNGKIMEEYQRKLDENAKNGSINGVNVNHYLRIIREKGLFGGVFVTPPIYIPADPSDNIFLASENCLRADYLITYNKHFDDSTRNDLKQIGSNLKIVTPTEYVEIRAQR